MFFLSSWNPRSFCLFLLSSLSFNERVSKRLISLPGWSSIQPLIRELSRGSWMLYGKICSLVVNGQSFLGYRRLSVKSLFHDHQDSSSKSNNSARSHYRWWAISPFLFLFIWAHHKRERNSCNVETLWWNGTSPLVHIFTTVPSSSRLTDVLVFKRLPPLARAPLELARDRKHAIALG